MVNIKVKDVPVIPAGIPTTVACEAILKVPNDADSDCNWTRTHNHLVHKRTLNHLAKLAK